MFVSKRILMGTDFKVYAVGGAVSAEAFSDF